MIGKMVTMRGKLYYFHGHRQDDNIDEMSSMVQIFKNGSFLMLENRPFGQEFEDDYLEFTLLKVQPSLYYRRQYKEIMETL